MFNYLSKLLPLFVYPAGLAWLCLILALSLRNRRRLQVGLLWLGLLTLGLGGNQFVAMALWVAERVLLRRLATTPN